MTPLREMGWSQFSALLLFAGLSVVTIAALVWKFLHRPCPVCGGPSCASCRGCRRCCRCERFGVPHYDA